MIPLAPVPAYVGPGTGFAFLGSFLTLAASLAAGVASAALWPVRALRRKMRRRGRKARVKRVVFLGLDGLDPRMTERLMAEGKMPNLARLRERGGYSRLRTTYPALSPVAWSSFATGVNPARHNIFDFLNRDLRTYAPEMASARVRPGGKILRIGRWRIPLSRPVVEMRRKSEPFWVILGRHAIGSTILRVPVTFPPDEFDGRLLSAMPAPDLRGTQGSYSWFTADGKTGENRYPLRECGDGYEGEIAGPEDPFGGSGTLAVRFRLTRRGGAWRMAIGGEEYSMEPGRFSEWIRLRFRAAGAPAVYGVARFLLREEGGVSVYATPVQIDPERPALPISHPSTFAMYLAKRQGSFATLGLAEDTWALNDGALSESEFLEQAASIQREREEMFFSALERTRSGAVACVFDTSDRVQHMFYRHMDGRMEGGEHAAAIENMYRDMDRLAGQTMEKISADDALFVLSDHGFQAFRRGVNLNAWLWRNGYLALETGRMEGGEYLEGIDWSRTKAYAFGLGGLYLNKKGREARGIVEKSEAGALAAELKERLAGLRDEEDGREAIRRVYAAEELYRGPYREAAPDLVVGYGEGYRASWDGVKGKVTARVFEDNDKAWSGDHCVDPELVPGVLFSSFAIAAENPGIEDMAATALELLGVPRPKWMEGRPVVAVG